MGYQIIKQPNGKFAVLSSISNTIDLFDATADELVSWFGENARVEAEENARRMVNKVAAGERAYHQFTKTWEQALQLHRKTSDGSDPEYDASLEAVK